MVLAEEHLEAVGDCRSSLGPTLSSIEEKLQSYSFTIKSLLEAAEALDSESGSLWEENSRLKAQVARLEAQAEGPPSAAVPKGGAQGPTPGHTHRAPAHASNTKGLRDLGTCSAPAGALAMRARRQSVAFRHAQQSQVPAKASSLPHISEAKEEEMPALPGAVESEVAEKAAPQAAAANHRKPKLSRQLSAGVPDALGQVFRRLSKVAFAPQAESSDDEEDGVKVESLISKHARPILPDAEGMKERVRSTIGTPVYNVAVYYKTSGPFQAIARSHVFENIMLVVISLNSIWLSVDTEYNQEPILYNAHPAFQVFDNMFCLAFSTELFIRFMAFQHKRDCLRDAWFIFDAVLVVVMIVQTWVMMLVMALMGATQAPSTSSLRILRLLRLVRVARIARLLNSFPELMVLIKGIGVAARSVAFTLGLLLLLIYFFAVAFASITIGTDLKEEVFPGVLASMAFLAVTCITPNSVHFVYGVGGESVVFGLVLMLFFLISATTVMNMLIGVLVEVVGVVSVVEKEHTDVLFVKGILAKIMRSLDSNGDGKISKTEFAQIIEQPEAIRAITHIGVDVVGMIDCTDYFFEDDDTELNFDEFMQMLLQLRGKNKATVKDMVDMRKFVLQELSTLKQQLPKEIERAFHEGRHLIK